MKRNELVGIADKIDMKKRGLMTRSKSRERKTRVDCSSLSLSVTLFEDVY
jgi:hypothetical protein